MSELFPPRPDAHPLIYAFTETNTPFYQKRWKVGYTARTLEKRMSEHYPTAHPDALPYEALELGPAIRSDGSTFMDHAVFERLKAHGINRLRAADGTLTEWVECPLDAIKSAYNEVITNQRFATERTETFPMRQEQQDAVDAAAAYYENAVAEGVEKPQFLWNAKMRFGKTFAAYQLAKKMGLKRILVMSFKTAVEAAWEDDLATHVDFEGWQFVTRDGDLDYEDCDPDRPIVCFGSFQDILQLDAKTGTIKQHNKWIHNEDWDIVILDEYHFGAWRENAQKLFESMNRSDEDIEDPTDEELEDIKEAGDENEWELPITAKYYLYLSGTPFRALNSGEFMEDQIFSWTYSDEQARKESWNDEHPGQPNPYEALPRVVLMTYRVPEAVIKIARKGENNRFSLNEFFRAEGEEEQAQFVHKDEVQKWLDFIRSKYTAEEGEDLKISREEKPPFPFADSTLLDVLVHTLWFLPNVASCYAMANLLAEKKNIKFYGDYDVIVCAGPKVGNGVEALGPVREAMGDPTKTKTITLSCGKLTTGVTVKPWAGIFMLRDLNSPETYFQSAFRPQSPWVVDVDDENGIVHGEIMKREVYIFDFAIQRALSMVATYAAKLTPHGGDIEKSAAEFIQFLPVLAYDDGIMTPLNAEQILDMTVSDTTATMLARRWKSALLVNVDDATLNKVLDHPDALKILDNIESFRANSRDNVEKITSSKNIREIVNSSEDIKQGKKEAAEKGEKPAKEITDEERKLRKLRSKLQKVLLKFISRIPVFMYLTDNREQCLEDVIRKLEPGLFTNVTGITVQDFEVLLELGVIDEERMNESVFLFRRYEDSSLTYTGIDKKSRSRNIGLFSRTITEDEFSAADIDDIEDDLLGLVDTDDDLDQDPAEDGDVVEIDADTTSRQPDVQEDNNNPAEGVSAPADDEESGNAVEDNEKSQRKEWTRSEILALKVGSLIYHHKYGACKVLGFNDKLTGICVEVNGSPVWYSIPAASESSTAADDEDIAGNDGDEDDDGNSKEKKPIVRKHGKDYKTYWQHFYEYCKNDPEMLKLYPGTGDREARENVYVSLSFGFGNDCRLDVYYRVATGSVNLQIWCQSKEKRYQDLYQGKERIEATCRELDGTIKWDKIELDKSSRKAEVSHKMNVDETQDFKWICDWAKALKPIISEVLGKDK